MKQQSPHNGANASPTDHATRVLLVGERFLLLDALRLALTADKINVAVVGTKRQGVEEAVNLFHPGVVVFDGSGTPIGAIALSIRSLKKHDVIVVGIASESVSVEAAQMASAGADCVLGLDTGFDDLAETISQALDGQAILPLDRRYILEQLLREHRTAEQRRWLRFEELTERERAIFALVYEGMSADQIADDACVSLSTVRTHIRNILCKLDVNSQLAAVAMARAQDWFAESLIEPA